MRLAWIVAATVCSSSGAATAQMVTGNDLLSACEGIAANTVQGGFCLGYMVGVNEGLKLGATLPFIISGDTRPPEEMDVVVSNVLGVCLPTGAEYQQQVDVTIQYLQAHPETRHEPARSLMLQAFQEAFPCSSP